LPRLLIALTLVLSACAPATAAKPPHPPHPHATTTTAATTTITTTTTTQPPPSGQFSETFSANPAGWTFAHKEYEEPGASTPASPAASAVVTAGMLHITNPDQNYGDATMRSPVGYNLAAGPLTLDISDNGEGWPLIGSAYLLLSAAPSDANLMASNDDSVFVPGLGNAVQVWLRDNCRVPWGPPIVVTYSGTARTTQRGTCGTAGTAVGPRRIVVTQGHVSIRTSSGVEIVAYDAAVPTTGYVQLGIHNHASLKYTDGPGPMPAVVGMFDNLSYNGGATSPPPTTTTTTTVAPPSGTQFSETFTSDQRARFDWRLQTTVEPPQGDFIGEHDLVCNGPDTHRTVHQIPLQWGTAYTNVDVTNSEMVWWCAPGNDPATGHMMTALDTGSIATVSFTPKATFNNVTKVCWNQNMNNLGEGKWINVFVIPAAAYSGDPAYGASSADENTPGAIPQRPPSGSVDFTWLRGTIFANKWNSTGHQRTQYVWMSNDDGMDPSPAPRFKICLNSGMNQITVQRPGHLFGPAGRTDVYPLGTTFPTGQVKVIFQDASYNPTKHNGFTDHLTWHWDDISIS
jgi:hypothetical protein